MDEFGIIAKYFAPLAGEGAFGLQDDAALLAQRPGHDLVVIDVEQAKPALLPHGERDETGQFDELFFVEVVMESLPECVIGFESPGDGFGVRERCFFTVIVGTRGLEIN